jgi:hypothetical protein
MSKFSVGNKVKRTAGEWGNMKVGDVDEIIGNNGIAITLKRFGEGHDPRFFELVTIISEEIIYEGEE